MLNFAQHDLPLEWVVNSIDTALQSVDHSLQCVGGTLGVIHGQSGQATHGAHDPTRQVIHDPTPLSTGHDPTLVDHLEESCIAPDQYNAKAYEHTRGIPPEVLRQLQEAGINVEFLSRGELHDAAIGFEGDGRVIDDHEDTTLRGKLTLNGYEVSSRQSRSASQRTSIAPPQEDREEVSTELVIPRPVYSGSFVAKLLQERMRQIDEEQLSPPLPKP